MNLNKLEKVINDLDILKKAYDYVRLVDPVKKTVINLPADDIDASPAYCYDFWGKNKVCDDCIAVRAFRDDKTYVRIDYNDDRIFLLTAIPIELEGEKAVLETIKDATDSLILDSSDKDRYSEIHTLIDSMNNLASVDSLTKIFNRHYINNKLPVEIAKAINTNTYLSVIIADIDHFKEVNDTYGHLIGDCVLKLFSKQLSYNLKRYDGWLARYGGEEFLICLPGADTKKAAIIAEKMRKRVEDNIMSCGGNNLKITASFGVSTMAPKDIYYADNLIDMADKKLYEAKQNGRNRVEY